MVATFLPILASRNELHKDCTCTARSETDHQKLSRCPTSVIGKVFSKASIFTVAAAELHICSAQSRLQPHGPCCMQVPAATRCSPLLAAPLQPMVGTPVLSTATATPAMLDTPGLGTGACTRFLLASPMAEDGVARRIVAEALAELQLVGLTQGHPGLQADPQARCRAEVRPALHVDADLHRMLMPTCTAC